MDVLDNPAWHALSGPLRRFAVLEGDVAVLEPDVGPFAALAGPPDAAAWAALAHLTGPGRTVVVVDTGQMGRLGAGWSASDATAGVQLVGPRVQGSPDAAVEVLGPEDVDEMLALVDRTRPGPFHRRTVELGTYLGLRIQGRLVAMAGERMRLPGFTEISAVCTDPAERGRGLAARLVGAVSAGITGRDEVPILHVASSNVAALRLYRALGYAARRDVTFRAVTYSGHGSGD